MFQWTMTDLTKLALVVRRHDDELDELRGDMQDAKASSRLMAVGFIFLIVAVVIIQGPLQRRPQRLEVERPQQGLV